MRSARAVWAGGGTACAAPTFRRGRGTNVLFGCESSRGLACVLVRCSLYPWASGSACRVDIEGGAVLGSLFFLPYRVPPMPSARGQPRSLISAAVCAWLAPQGIRGCICVIIRQPFRDLGTKLKVDVCRPQPIRPWVLFWTRLLWVPKRAANGVNVVAQLVSLDPAARTTPY